MSKHKGRELNAVKHGAFARDAVLPGESREDFEELYRSLFDDLEAEGRFEEETVLSIAKLLWAQQRLERWSRAKVDEARIEREMAPLRRVAFFELHPLLMERPTQEDLDNAISQCPEPYCSLIRKELGKLGPNVSFDEYAKIANRCAANLLNRFRKEVEIEPSSPDYQQALLSKIEKVQEEYINSTERLNAMIDRLFKRNLQLKAYKEILHSHPGAKTIESTANEGSLKRKSLK